jgi:hypothetical protein
VTVGANRFQSDEQPLEQLQIDQTAQKSQEQNLAALSRSLSGLQTNWTQFVSALVVGEPATAPEFVLRLLLSRELRDVQVRISVAVTLFDFFTRLHFCRLPFGHGHTTEFFFKTKPPEGMNINPPG